MTREEFGEDEMPERSIGLMVVGYAREDPPVERLGSEEGKRRWSNQGMAYNRMAGSTQFLVSG